MLPGMQGSPALGAGSVLGRFGGLPGGSFDQGSGRVAAALAGQPGMTPPAVPSPGQLVDQPLGTLKDAAMAPLRGIQDFARRPLQTATAPLMAPIEQAKSFVQNPGGALKSAAMLPIEQAQQIFKRPLDPLNLFGVGSQSVTGRVMGTGPWVREQKVDRERRG
jgi:hypothetical protein